MKRFIVVADGGQTLGPNCQPCDNLQVLGFAWGKNEEDALKNFLEDMKDDYEFQECGWDEENIAIYQLAKEY